MHKELCTYKSASPSESMPTAANFHLQVLNSHSNKSHFGETFILAYIPGDMHQRVFERAVVTFEDHYYRSEIEDTNLEKFSRSIRAINTGMEEIRQYYKEHRHNYEYSFCILTVTESDFLLSACGLCYVLAEDATSRLHEVYKPEEFLEFSEIISGSHNNLKQLFLAITNSQHVPLSAQLEDLAYSILLATQNRVELPWTTMEIGFQTPHQPINHSTTVGTGIFAKTHKQIKKQYRSIKSRIISRGATPKASTVGAKTKSGPTKKITKSAQSFWTKLWSTYINPNPLRALIVIGATLAIIIAGVIGWNILGSSNKTSLQYQKIQNLYVSAQTSKSNQDIRNSESQFSQVIDQISQLSSSEKTAINKYAASRKQPSLDEITQNSQVQLDEIHNIFRIPATKVYSETNFAYSLLTLTSTQLNLLNPSTGKALSFNAVSKKTTSKNQSTLIDSKWLISSNETTSSYAISDKSVYQIKPDLTATESRTTSVSWPVAQSAATYANNLYFLMPSAGQIYRFRSVGTNQFGPQTNYLKSSDSSLNDAVSFVVGNTIFTTTKTGIIRQYSQNVAQSFTTSGTPQLNNVSQIAYRAAPESLVLLDIEKNAFIIFTIQGNTAVFQRELVVNNTTNITNFSINDKDNQLYFVSKDGLYSLALP